MIKYKGIFVIGLLLYIGYFRFTTLDTVNTPISPPSSAESGGVTVSETKLEEKSADTSDIQIPKVAKLYNACSDFEDNYRKAEVDWLENKKPDWERFLDEGYSVDEVTTAVEYFQNSNFAVSFRVEQLRTNSSLVKDNNSLMQQARSIFPDIFKKNSPFSVAKSVPQSALKNFNTLSSAEKISVLDSNKPTVDDLAYFINDTDYSEEDVLAMLSKLEDPSAIVGYNRLDAISLLDYAAKANRVGVVEYLLGIGVDVTEDAYLGSTMDWALTSLMIASEGQQKDAAKIVSLIWNNDGRANFIEPLEDGIEGRFPRQFFRFSNEDINLLQQRYGIDLRLVEQRNSLKVNSDSPLIKQLRRSRENYLSVVLERDNANDFRQECKNVVADLNGIWNPLSINNVVQANINEDESFEVIKARLAAIDPILVDTYLKQIIKKHSFTHVSGLDAIFRKVGKSTIFEIIDEVLALGLSEKENNYVVIQLLLFDSSYFDELKSSGLLIQEPTYSMYETFRLIKLKYIKSLYESGANLTSMDEYGKTLVYYAAKNSDLALLKYISEERFPYKLSEIGEDALHVILKEQSLSSRTKRPFYIYDAVVALMEFNPEVDEHHLSRMALLKYTAPYNYLKIVEQYPELEPNAETPLPNVRF
jgi:hypothetical protein